jgi:outer membrane protein TolC
LNDLGVLKPLIADTLGLQSITALVGNPNVAYEQQAVRVAEQQFSLAKSQALPNFSLGYLNQGARSTPLNYRFRASVGIPLWTGQYQGARQRAESEAKAAQSRVAAQSQSTSLEFANTSSEAMSALGKIRYYEQEALQRSC